MKIRTPFFALTLGLALMWATPGHALDATEAAAVEAANQWLELIDSGDFDESWTRASSLFRNSVTQAQWRQSLSAARGPFGKLLSRKVRGAQYAESLPGAPDGRYVVIQYDAVYEKKQRAVETVTPMYDNGAWRVSGYFIR